MVPNVFSQLFRFARNRDLKTVPFLKFPGGRLFRFLFQKGLLELRHCPFFANLSRYVSKMQHLILIMEFLIAQLSIQEIFG